MNCNKARQILKDKQEKDNENAEDNQFGRFAEEPGDSSERVWIAQKR